jgi:PTS system nitrogen regulatory IIA component
VSDLDRYLAPERVRLDVAAASRLEVLDALAELLGGRDEATREAVRDDLDRREQMGSTGVGGGIAFPHARVASLPGLRLAIVRTATAIDFSARDGRPVDLFVAVAGPESARREYLGVLGALSYVFRLDRVRDRVRAVESAEAAVELMRQLSAETARPA